MILGAEIAIALILILRFPLTVSGLPLKVNDLRCSKAEIAMILNSSQKYRCEKPKKANYAVVRCSDVANSDFQLGV
jgi:hypothetical protein